MKVIVLKEGVHVDFDKENPDLGCKEICGTVVLLKAEKEGEENIVVDTGNLSYEEEIIEALEKEGLKPEDITTVLMTHLHLDHISNHYLFKNARRVSGKFQLNPDKSLTKFNEELSKEVRIIKTPGHVPKHYSIVVESEGKTFVMAGDAIQEVYIKNIPKGFPPNQNYIDSAKKIVEIADMIIPGHGKIIQGKDLEELKEYVNKLEVK